MKKSEKNIYQNEDINFDFFPPLEPGNQEVWLNQHQVHIKYSIPLDDLKYNRSKQFRKGSKVTKEMVLPCKRVGGAIRYRKDLVRKFKRSQYGSTLIVHENANLTANKIDQTANLNNKTA